MARILLMAAIAVMGIIYIFFIPADPVVLKIVMKLIPMALIIALAATTLPLVSKKYKRIIIAGLFICMIADGVIYWFMAGLVTFFIGHLFYIYAFKQAIRKKIPIWVAALLLLYGAAMAIVIAGSQFKIGHVLLGVAIIAYIIVILTMGWMAIRTGFPLAIAGAVLFIFSDSVLAIDRFVIDIPYRDAFVMVTYYAAQFLIALSIGSRVVTYSVKRSNLIR